MNPHPILYPLFAQVTLSFLVWLWMYITRIHSLRRQGMNGSELRYVEDEQRLLKDVRGPSENLINLFELPVLFYAACLLADFHRVDGGYLVLLAWGFVGFRALHSLIHCTYNHVLQRFTVYILSSICLWGMWFELFRILA